VTTWAFEISGIGDVASAVTEPKGRYRICRPSAWDISVPLWGDSAVTGWSPISTRLKVRRNGGLVHHGMLMKFQKKGTRDDARAVLTFMDPMVWWAARRVRDVTGNFAKPEFDPPITGGQILRQSITHSIAFENGGVNSHMGISLGADSTIKDLSFALRNTPISIGETAILLGATGVCDFYIHPVDGGFTSMGELRTFHHMGTDLSGTCHFDYATGNHDVEEIIHSGDATKFCNALWYFMSKIDDEHWEANITRDDPGLPDPPQSTLLGLITASRAAYGYWQDMRFWDEDDAVGIRRAFRKMWQLEQLLRLKPKELLFVTPGPESAFQPWDSYFLGDDVGINANLGGGLAARQRVYGFDVMPHKDGPDNMGPIITSADADSHS
jgi:hypothetical protein